MNCSKCYAPVYLTDLICLQCGHISDNYAIKDAHILKEITLEVDKINNVIGSASHDLKSYNWNPKVANFASKIYQTKQLLQWGQLAQLVPEDLNKQIDNFLKYSSDAEIHVAFVGAIKAGKSSLINALLKEDLASISVTPETASLTKFKASETNQHSIKVTFYSRDEWSNLWNSAQEGKATVFINEYNKLQAEAIKDDYVGKKEHIIACQTINELKKEIFKWSSSKTATHYFVKELEIGLANTDIPKGVVFVDTPGLDDVVDYRSNITREYIDRANAVLVCVRSEALTGSEMSTIIRVFANTRHNPEKVYIIGTKYDALNLPEVDWQKQREEWLKYLEVDSAYGSRELAEKNLVITSSMLYQIAMHEKDTDISSDKFFGLMSVLAKFKLMPDQIEANTEKLIEISNVAYLNDKINKTLLLNYQDDLVKDIDQRFVVLRKQINKFVKEVAQSQTEILEVTQKSLDEIENFKNKQMSLLNKLNKEKLELEEDLANFEKTATERSKELLDAVRALKM